MSVLISRPRTAAVDGLARAEAVLGKVTDVAAVDGGTVSESAGMVSAEVSVGPDEDEVLGRIISETVEAAVLGKLLDVTAVDGGTVSEPAGMV